MNKKILLIGILSVILLAVLLWGKSKQQGLKSDQGQVIITSVEVSCTKMVSGNTCSGSIVYKENGQENTAKVSSTTVVYDLKTAEFDGALLYKVNQAPLKAKLEFNTDNSLAKITIIY